MGLDKKKKILIIDDEPFLARVLSDKLSAEGFLVACAKNGEEGLREVFKDRPDIVLLDLVMPKMDGMTMLKKLRRDERGRDLPVIVFSNLNNDKIMNESFASGASDFLVKVNNSLDGVTRIIKSRLDS